MAFFHIKRGNYATTQTRGLKSTMNDNTMKVILDAYRVNYGEKPAVRDAQGVETEPARPYTDDEITDLIFTGILNGMAQQGETQAKIKVAKDAAATVPPVSAPITPDNT